MEMQKYVIELLGNYNQMKQEIEALGYELTHFETENPEATIEAMTFSSSADERITGGNVSNKTPDIALNYVKKHEELNATAICEINARLRFLNETVDRLDFYIEKMDACQAAILQAYYFEGYTWLELQDLRGVTEKTLRKYRDDGVKTLAQKYSSLQRLGLL